MQRENKIVRCQTMTLLCIIAFSCSKYFIDQFALFVVFHYVYFVEGHVSIMIMIGLFE